MSHSISLIGNPNCGKTTVFNALTGSHQRVGNWPGVTVDKKTGYYQYNDKKYEIIDLPGTYAIEADSKGLSQDEMIARNFVLNDKDSLLINIIDASNLQRNLFLTFQLIELNRPLIIVVNMMDMAKKQGLHIDIDALQQALGHPVVPIIASKGQGVKNLKQVIADSLNNNSIDNANRINTITSELQRDIENFLAELPEDSAILKLSDLNLLDLLACENTPAEYSDKEKTLILKCRTTLSEAVGGNGVDIAIVGARYEIIDQLCAKIVHEVGVASSALTEKLDHFALGKWTALPFFLIVMFLMFQFAINMGSAFIDFIDITFGALLVDDSRLLLEMLNAPEWLITLLSDGIGVGIQTTATFIPVIFFMFLFLSFLEDSGYLARAAMVVDRVMRFIGLPGKAFVPMVVGFGCNIPAIMGTRTLENANDRLLSITMIPFMSCGARLPVYALFVALFFPKTGGIIVYALYLFGIFIAILTGLLIKKTILQSDLSPFIMELPLYHRPTIKGLLLSTWQRLKAFIVKAGRAILVVVVVLSIFNSLGTDGSFGHANTDKSLLAVSAKAITPVFEPMGLTEENWPATVGIITGILAKEVVIGTLNTLYQQIATNNDYTEDEQPSSFSIMPAFKEAVETTIDNLKELPSRFADPLAIDSKLAGGDIATVQEENDVSGIAVQKIDSLFPNKAAVLAYLIFILLYTPCVAALGAIYRETDLKWTLLVAIWCFVIAWICATIFYQLFMLSGPFYVHAIIYLIAIFIALILIFELLKYFGKALFLGNKGEK